MNETLLLEQALPCSVCSQVMFSGGTATVMRRYPNQPPDVRHVGLEGCIAALAFRIEIMDQQHT